MEKFRAYRVHDDGKFGSGRAETMTRAEFDAGNVMVRIAFASVNYKDALTARGKAKIARRFPLVAGIDLAGTVESSQDARFKPGDEVIVHSFGLGGEHDGGYAEFKGNVLPFILRGVRLLGTNVENPLERKKAIWQRLASDLKPRHLARVARCIRFDGLDQAFDDLLAARARGRQVVDFSLG